MTTDENNVFSVVLDELRPRTGVLLIDELRVIAVWNRDRAARYQRQVDDDKQDDAARSVAADMAAFRRGCADFFGTLADEASACRRLAGAWRRLLPIPTGAISERARFPLASAFERPRPANLDPRAARGHHFKP